ncbi:Uncharacterised protein [Cedecea neteri]|uniref:Uncharacterized protein n=1 Tax=Cedecea neteri TaxID=158822 RepID=A0A2X3IVX8_9ENTR|nr:Uncharacterised protein [Cedecea neteri]
MSVRQVFAAMNAGQTFGKGSYGQFIDTAGGNNIGSKLFPEMSGQVKYRAGDNQQSGLLSG